MLSRGSKFYLYNVRCNQASPPHTPAQAPSYPGVESAAFSAQVQRLRGCRGPRPAGSGVSVKGGTGGCQSETSHGHNQDITVDHWLQASLQICKSRTQLIMVGDCVSPFPPTSILLANSLGYKSLNQSLLSRHLQTHLITRIPRSVLIRTRA